MIISNHIIAIVMAMTFVGSACAPTVKVSNYIPVISVDCDVVDNYAGTKIYHDHPLVLAQVFDKDYDVFVDRINVISKQKVSPKGDHGYVVGDAERIRMMILILDKHECIVGKISLSPAFYEYIMSLGDRLVFLHRSDVV